MATAKRSLCVALIVSSALVAGACSNAKDDNGGVETGVKNGSGAGGKTQGQFADLKRVAAPSPCKLDPGVTTGEIKVGGLVPETGARAVSFQSSEAGIKGRFEMANANHELGARKIVFKPVDDAGNAARNGEAARQLVESEKVFGVVEVSDQADGSAAYLHDKGIPVTGWHVGVPAWSRYANMFTFRSPIAADPNATYSTRNVELLKRLGATKLALVGGGNQSSASFLERIAKTTSAVKSLEVVYKVTDVPAASTEFTAVVQRIKEAGADAVYTGMDLVQNAALSDQLTKAGVHLKAVVFPGGYDSRVLHLPGIENAIFGLEFRPFELNPPAFRDFDKWTAKDAPRGQVTYIGWLAANLFIEGLKRAGVACPTRKAFIANLRLMKGYTGNGAFDPVDFAADFGKEFQCVYYVQVRNAAFQPLFDGKRFCGRSFALK